MCRLHGSSLLSSIQNRIFEARNSLHLNETVSHGLQSGGNRYMTPQIVITNFGITFGII